jgi:hypothetical protein
VIVAPSGGGGPSWTGSIVVEPGQLEASSPGFTAAGNQVMEVMAGTTLPWADPAGTGITDPGAAAAWSTLTSIWNGDLQHLSDALANLGLKLAVNGSNYQASDAAAMRYVIHATVVTQQP